MAGSVQHDSAVDLIGKHFGEWSGEAVDHVYAEPAVEPRVRLVKRDTEQAHLVLGGRGINRGDDRRFAFDVLNHIVGGGMSSRLFLKIREERGLAYSVYSFRQSHSDTGGWGVYVGTTPDFTETCMEMIEAELADVARDGITSDELDRAKGSLRGGLALSTEDPNSRMVRLGRDELAGSPHLSVDDRIARLEDVTLDAVKEVAEAVYTGPRVLGAVGPFEPGDLDRWVQ
jgi:predicted Zn-dependent peptidase